jgi:hypothetical protein
VESDGCLTIGSTGDARALERASDDLFLCLYELYKNLWLIL